MCVPSCFTLAQGHDAAAAACGIAVLEDVGDRGGCKLEVDAVGLVPATRLMNSEIRISATARAHLRRVELVRLPLPRRAPRSALQCKWSPLLPPCGDRI